MTEVATCDRHLPHAMRKVTDSRFTDTGPTMTTVSVRRMDQPGGYWCACGAPATWRLRGASGS